MRGPSAKKSCCLDCMGRGVHTVQKKLLRWGEVFKIKLTCYTVRHSLGRRIIGEMNEIVIEENKMSIQGKKVIGLRGVYEIRRMSKVKRLRMG